MQDFNLTKKGLAIEPGVVIPEYLTLASVLRDPEPTDQDWGPTGPARDSVTTRMFLEYIGLGDIYQKPITQSTIRILLDILHDLCNQNNDELFKAIQKRIYTDKPQSDETLFLIINSFGITIPTEKKPTKRTKNKKT